MDEFMKLLATAALEAAIAVDERQKLENKQLDEKCLELLIRQSLVVTFADEYGIAAPKLSAAKATP